MSLRREPFYQIPEYPDADPLVLGAQLRDIYLFLFCLVVGLVLLLADQTLAGLAFWVVGYWVNKYWIKFKRAQLGDLTNVLFFRLGLKQFSKAFTRPWQLFITDTPVRAEGVNVEN